MKLAALEELFWRSVRFDPAPPEVQAEFVGRGSLDAFARMGIYRAMYWYRLVQALFDTFPRVATLLGEKTFTEVSCRYIHAHPSEDPILERFGRHLAEFLRGEEVGAAVADIAELEWTRLVSFLSEDTRPWSLAAAAADLRDAVRLRPVPSLRLVSVPSATLELWDRRGADETLTPPRGLRAVALDVQVLCVWRRGFAVHQVAVQRDEAIALGHLLRGESFGVLCEAFASAAEPEKRAASVVAKWFDDERIATPEEHVN